jgi:uncharacterized protein (DUF2336 family)
LHGTASGVASLGNFVALHADGALAPETMLELLDERVEAAPDVLAKCPDIDPSVLVFLAENGGPATRRAVARHRCTPPDINLRLAKDPDWQVREQLARKISRQLFNLNEGVPRALRETTFRIVERLARDRVSAVRATLAHEVKHLREVPRHVVVSLALDEDEGVSGPVLEGSPLLTEVDLLRIISSEEGRGALKFIARRQPLSANLCDAIVFRLEPEALSALLANTSAVVRQAALEHIADNADAVASCLDSLALRAELSPLATRKVALVAGRRTLERLLAVRVHDPETQALLEQELAARLAEPAARRDDVRDPTEAVHRARRLGTLDDAFVRAAADRGDLDIVVAALVELASTPGRVVRRILLSRSSNAVASLARRAGLSMRTAYRILSLVTKHPPVIRASDEDARATQSVDAPTRRFRPLRERVSG